MHGANPLPYYQVQPVFDPAVARIKTQRDRENLPYWHLGSRSFTNVRRSLHMCSNYDTPALASTPAPCLSQRLGIEATPAQTGHGTTCTHICRSKQLRSLPAPIFVYLCRRGIPC